MDSRNKERVFLMLLTVIKRYKIARAEFLGIQRS